MIHRAFGLSSLFLLITGGLVRVRASVPTPDLHSWTAAERWYQEVGPETALTSALLQVALGLSVWLLLAATVQLVAAVVRGPLTTAAAAMLAPRSLQRYVQGLATASFAAGLAVTPPSNGWLPSAGEPVGEPGTATLELIVPAPSPAAPTPEPTPSNALAAVTVQTGDSFWSIAEAALRAARPEQGPPPTAAEVARYWQRLVAANTGILVVPTDPDLLYRGQVVSLPPVSPDLPGSPPSLAP